MHDSEFPYGANVNWSREQQPSQQWNEIAAWTVEYFGLPGNRFICDVNIGDMTWWFRDQHDRTLFVLRVGQVKCIQLDSTVCQ